MLEHTSRNRSSSLPGENLRAGRSSPRCRVNAVGLTTEHHYDLSLQVDTRQVVTLKVS
jgi:hypothetical protein